jgi:hypothetical protein
VDAKREPRGTVGHPYSALNLRLALAIFGLVAFTALSVAGFWLDLPVLGILAAAVALGAVVNIVVVQRRRVQRARREPGVRHSLFE